MSDEARFRDLLHTNFDRYKELTDRETSLLYTHYELLSRWNRVLNLTSIQKLEEIVLRHYCESLFLTIHLPEKSATVLDVGSGPGFPGIPLAILRPDCTVVLAESHQRKAVFLREATRELPNVRVAPKRADQVGKSFEWVVSRAVRWADVLKVVTGNCALLLGQEDARSLTAVVDFHWQNPIVLPWGDRRVLAIGNKCTS
ncbi:MAG: 16S rRNA (guanine(527)-N(7))-methyltransferase RsmG [Bryobacteraceae bacterium]